MSDNRAWDENPPASYEPPTEIDRLRGEVERLRGHLNADIEAMAAQEAEIARLRGKCDGYEAAIRWVLARNTSGIVLGGYDKPMVMHLLEALDG